MRYSHLLLCTLLAGTAAPCAAQVHGQIDENGMVHWSRSGATDHVYVLSRAVPLPDMPAPPIPPEAPQAAPVTGLESPSTTLLRKRHAPLIARVAQEQEVDPALLHALITVESAYNARARSPKGAAGLMQLMPGTAQRYGVKNIWSPDQNLRGGARYLKDLLALFKDDLRLALAAYNAGENAVMNSGNTIPPYRETRNYVPRVLGQYERYRTAQSW